MAAFINTNDAPQYDLIKIAVENTQAFILELIKILNKDEMKDLYAFLKAGKPDLYAQLPAKLQIEIEKIYRSTKLVYSELPNISDIVKDTKLDTPLIQKPAGQAVQYFLVKDDKVSEKELAVHTFNAKKENDGSTAQTYFISQLMNDRRFFSCVCFYLKIHGQLIYSEMIFCAQVNTMRLIPLALNKLQT